MQTVNLSLLVHAQKNFSYTTHPKISNIQKYIDSENSVQLVVEGYGKPIFKTIHIWESTTEGKFDRENIDKYLKIKKINPEEATNIEITLLGGEFTKCLSEAFYTISTWEAETNFLNRTAVTMPTDAVFEYEKRSFLLNENHPSYPLLPFIAIHYNLNGQIIVSDMSIELRFRKTPKGILNNIGELLVPME
ncbi:MAG: hypothetical protein ACOYT4_02340 [Nanoarchaeota archaeon]